MGKIINTDFSAKITTFATRNSKNDVIWSLSRESAGDMLDAPEEKFKKAVIAAWREIDDDKALCRHLMASLPHRLQAVIDKEGRQIQKEDY